MNERHTFPSSPIHPLSSVVIIALDNLYAIPEAAIPFSLPVTMVLALITCSLSVTFTQRFLARDAWGPAVAKGFAMGILAALPYQVFGTTAGAVLIGWSGMAGLYKLLNPPGVNRL